MTKDEREPRFYPWPGGLYMMGRFSVPYWAYRISPNLLHHAADWCGGVEPSPWGDTQIDWSTICREFLTGVTVAAIAVTPCLILLLGLAVTR